MELEQKDPSDKIFPESAGLEEPTLEVMNRQLARQSINSDNSLARLAKQYDEEQRRKHLEDLSI